MKKQRSESRASCWTRLFPTDAARLAAFDFHGQSIHTFERQPLPHISTDQMHEDGYLYARLPLQDE